MDCIIRFLSKKDILLKPPIGGYVSEIIEED